MTMGIQLWGSTGVLEFDSNVATGGVCLGFFTVAGGGSTWTFPSITGATGIALVAGAGNNGVLYTQDNVLGYLRFIFNSLTAGVTFVLFAK